MKQSCSKSPWVTHFTAPLPFGQLFDSGLAVGFVSQGHGPALCTCSTTGVGKTTTGGGNQITHSGGQMASPLGCPQVPSAFSVEQHQHPVWRLNISRRVRPHLWCENNLRATSPRRCTADQPDWKENSVRVHAAGLEAYLTCSNELQNWTSCGQESFNWSGTWKARTVACSNSCWITGWVRIRASGPKTKATVCKKGYAGILEKRDHHHRGSAGQLRLKHTYAANGPRACRYSCPEPLKTTVTSPAIIWLTCSSPLDRPNLSWRFDATGCA